MNEKFAHTPGFWDYGADPCIDNSAALEICKQNIDAHTKPSSGHFFVVYLPDGRRVALVGHGPDGEANARLISAAPELLEALQGALPFLEKYMEHDGYAAIRAGIARAAIAKAVGS